MTNLEKIKSDIQAMSAEEMVTRFYSLFSCEQCLYDCHDSDRECVKGKVKWLESEVE